MGPDTAAQLLPGGGGGGGGGSALPPFKLERFFARHEFCTRHLLCCSDRQAAAHGGVEARWKGMHAHSLLPLMSSQLAACLRARDRVPCAACATPAPLCSEPLTMGELLAMANADTLRQWENLRLAYTGAAVS